MFNVWLLRQNCSDRYKKDISSKLSKILSKSIYFLDDLYNELKEKQLNKYSTLAIRMILKYMEHLDYTNNNLIKKKKTQQTLPKMK